MRLNWPLWSLVVSRGVPQPPTTTHHRPPPLTTKDEFNTKVKWLVTFDQIKYKLIHNISQITAMDKISQYRQQLQQRRPSRPGQRRAGLVRGAAGWGG